MPAERYFYPERFEENQTVHFKDQESHHLVNVMRTKVGEAIEIVNGMGQLVHAVLESIDKKSSSLKVISVQTTSQPTHRLILAQAIPRLNRLDFIIEKCTELGVTEIWLFPAARSEKNEFSKNQLERLNTLMIAAMKQCGRLFLPKLTFLPTLKKWNEIDIQPIFFGDTDPNAPPFFSKDGGGVFFIGPEGGFTEEEEGMLKQLGAQGVKLHDNILRTDTAAIVSITLLSYFTLFK
jgi:16S rRNA (uracil1498-N3)-methyltransferase